ncbi:MAG TPA: hypothetical protein PLV85_16735, partial [Polyangiaceae bacterium]|nr:hypothetical protein [Polyangiaceae bacterium]
PRAKMSLRRLAIFGDRRVRNDHKADPPQQADHHGSLFYSTFQGSSVFNAKPPVRLPDPTSAGREVVTFPGHEAEREMDAYGSNQSRASAIYQCFAAFCYPPSPP